jgi:hypothetical protein
VCWARASGSEGMLTSVPCSRCEHSAAFVSICECAEGSDRESVQAVVKALASAWLLTSTTVQSTRRLVT